MKRSIKWIIVGSLAVVALAAGSFCFKPVRDLFHRHEYAQAVTAPSCTEDGFTTFTCECGDTYTGNIVAAAGHDLTDTVTKPTYFSQGFTHHLCNVCGEEYTDTYTTMPDEVVASMAIKDYLQPAEEFSKARTQNPEFVMIHFSSAVVLKPTDPYNLKRNRKIFETYGVSTHYIMDREGTVRCYVPENLAAYHAGPGTWGDDPKYTDKLNQYAIGIEVMAIGSQKDMKQFLTPYQYNNLDKSFIGYTDAQYDALQALVKEICERYDIPMDRDHVIGHQEYAPGKPDPGELFDWDRLLSPTA